MVSPESMALSLSQRSRAPINPKLSWDDLDESVPKFKQAFEGTMEMVGLGYMFHPPHSEEYAAVGLEAFVERHPNLTSIKQMNLDLNYAYGALKFAFRGTRGQHYVTLYGATHDGIMVWRSFLEDFDNNGDKRVEVWKYENIIQTPFTRNYPGGLNEYIRKIEGAYVELNRLGMRHPMSTRLRTLLRTVMTEDTEEWVNKIEDDGMSFVQACRFLKTRGKTSDYRVQLDSKRQARTSSTTVVDEVDDSYDTATLNLLNYAYNTRAETNKDYVVHPRLWAQLSNSSKLDICKGRDKLLGGESAKRLQAGIDGRSPSRQLPQQYTNQNRQANLVGTDATQDVPDIADENVQTSIDEQSSDSDPDDYEEAARLILASSRFCHNVFSEESIRLAHTDYYVMARAFSGMRGQGIVISDAGADTWVFGKHWKQELVYTHRRANLVGFDANSARKFGLQIGTGVAMVDLSGQSIMIRVHEGVFNQTSDITLASEFQSREAGCYVDSVAKRHKHLNGKPGEQCFATPDRAVRIPFRILGALMAFNIREPSAAEYDEWKDKAYTLTLNQPWTPSSFTEDPWQTLRAQLAMNLSTRDDDDSDDNASHEDIEEQDNADDVSVADVHDAGEETFVATVPDSGEANVDHLSNSDAENFYDALSSFDEAALYIGPEVTPPEDLYYFDPSDNFCDRNIYGKAFHLTLDFDRMRHDQSAPPIDKSVYARATFIDEFLEELEDDELIGHNFPFDSFAFAVHTSQQLRAFDFIDDDSGITDIHGNVVQADLKPLDLEAIQPYLAYRPTEVIRKTLERTTQLATTLWRFPLRRHFQSLFPFLNRPRLAEIISTDTLFATVPSFTGRTCAQVFYGISSHVINVYGMRKESEFPQTYKDFMREEGIPTALRRDLAKAERSKKVDEINREYLIRDEFSEAKHQHQNPVESRAIRWLKQHMQVLMDRSGADERAWLHALMYLADINNICADETLDWDIPLQRRKGGFTIDISGYLIYKFWQPIYYLDSEVSFPKSKEKSGHWLGVAHNIGDHLTFWIWPTGGSEPIARSVVRPMDGSYPNRRVPVDDEVIDVDADTEEDEDDDEIFEEPMLAPDDGHETPQRPSDRQLSALEIINKTRRIASKKQQRRDRRRPNAQSPSRSSPSHQTTSETPEVSSPTVDNPSASTRTPAGSLLFTKGSGEETTGSDDETVPTSNVSGDPPATTDATVLPSEQAACDADLSPAGEALLASLPTPETQFQLRPRRQRNPVDRLNLNARRVKPHSRYQGLFALAGMAMLFFNFTIGEAATSSIEAPDMEHIPGIEPVMEAPDYSDVRKRDQLRYVQFCDRFDVINDADPDSHDWVIGRVLSHRVATNRRVSKKGDQTKSRHLRVHVQYMNGSKSWVQEAAVRLDDPIVLVRYAVDHKLEKHPDFKWVKEYTKDPDRIVELTQAMKAKQHGPKFKFGVEIPMSPGHALALDKKNGNHLWEEAMKKELDQINEYKTFLKVDSDTKLPTDFQRIPYHFVFDCKFDLRRKARLVAGGNWTDTPKEDIYSGVVGMDTIRLGFTVAAMNDLQVCAADIGNAFLYGKTREKVYIIAGPEFGELQGQRLIIDKGLYGLKSSAARFHEHLSAKLRSLDFVPTTADTDFWRKDCGDHYEFVATYVDDLLVYSRDPMSLIEKIKEDYILKGIGTPEYYLGANVDQLDEQWEKNGIHTALSAFTYIKNVTEKLEQMLGGLPFAKQKSPMSEAYHPELDDTPYLDQELSSKFRAIIGSANWIITLGRFDIAYSVNALSRFSMQPREGHLRAAKRIFGYLKSYPKGRIVIDPNFRDWSGYAEGENYDNWKEFYPDAEEEDPPKMPEPRGPSARITVYVDADHAHDQLTRRSVTGVLLFINNTPVKWVSKRQKTVETSTYGSELVAARIATDLIIEYRYILKILGVKIDGPALLLGDNKSVVLNTTVPSSILKKKHNAIAYHRVREAVAAGIMQFVHIDTDMNYADLLTKPLAPSKFQGFVKDLLFRTPFSYGQLNISGSRIA